MHLNRPVLLAALLVACGSDPASTATDSNTGTGTATTGETPTSTTVPTGTGTLGDASSSDGGTQGMTDSAATTGTTTGGDTSTSNPVQTDTGPAETTSTGPGETTGGTGSTGGTSTGPGESTSTGVDTTEGVDTTTGAVEGCPCPDLEVPLDDGIFVLSIDAELWKFFPETNQFQELGALGCDGVPPTTFSMAVDRLGFAWVQYSDGALRKVNVTDVSDCTDPGYVAGQQGVTTFGMAFVSNSQFDACDRLYGNRYNGNIEGNAVSDFFFIDPGTLKLGAIGKTNYGSAELTGTGDGRTYFFGGANPAKLIEIEKQSGASLSVLPLPNVEIGSAWAFAFFAGDFYFFTNSKGGPGSEVNHLDHDDSDNNGVQDLKTVVADAPISIVGAGVSTCAPLIPQ